MKSAKSTRNYVHSHANAKLKPKKLTIDVPLDDDLEEPRKKFEKNSPVATKVVSEIQRVSGSIFAPKHKTPPSTQSTKYNKVNPPKPKSRVFKFPSTPKPEKKQRPKPKSTTMIQPVPKPQPKKFSSTPTYRLPTEETKKRPKTTSNTEKNSDTGSSPNLNILLTQVKKVETGSESQNKNEVLYKEHLFQTFQAMKFVKSLQPANLEVLKEKRISVPRKKGYENKKTLIFDLDETLVHCCEDTKTCKPDVILPITFPTGEVIEAGINIRPYALECLKEANKEFEVFVFTASHPCYANVVLDYLDPKKELIHQRFFRDSCINVNGVFLKDLRIFANRNLRDLIIVDNAAYSFAYQMDNGIPIVSWHDDREDKELFNLMDYLKALAAVDDIRDMNEQTFHLRTFYEDYINEFLAGEPVQSKEGKKGGIKN